MIASAYPDPEPLDMNPRTAGATVIVPTLNRGPYLINTLHDLLAQDYRPLEILVVDQSGEERNCWNWFLTFRLDFLSQSVVSRIAARTQLWVAAGQVRSHCFRG